MRGPAVRIVSGLLACCVWSGLPARQDPPVKEAPVVEAEPERSASRAALDAIRDDLVGLEFEKALAAIESFLARPELDEVDRAEAVVLRVQAHVAFGDLSAAEQDYREILRMRPTYVPDARLITSCSPLLFAKVTASRKLPAAPSATPGSRLKTAIR